MPNAPMLYMLNKATGQVEAMGDGEWDQKIADEMLAKHRAGLPATAGDIDKVLAALERIEAALMKLSK